MKNPHENQIDISTIGEIEFQDFVLNEQQIGTLNFKKMVGNCTIQVYSNEGPIPHFHIINTSNNFQCCIFIYEPFYFSHEGKTCTLSGKQLEILDNWLSRPNKFEPSMTNWAVISFAWKLSNGDKNVPKNQVKPDYRNITNFKD